MTSALLKTLKTLSTLIRGHMNLNSDMSDLHVKLLVDTIYRGNRDDITSHLRPIIEKLKNGTANPSETEYFKAFKVVIKIWKQELKTIHETITKLEKL